MFAGEPDFPPPGWKRRPAPPAPRPSEGDRPPAPPPRPSKGAVSRRAARAAYALERERHTRERLEMLFFTSAQNSRRGRIKQPPADEVEK